MKTVPAKDLQAGDRLKMTPSQTRTVIAITVVGHEAHVSYLSKCGRFQLKQTYNASQLMTVFD